MGIAMDAYSGDYGLPLSDLRSKFENYAEVKRNEVNEQREAWRYYHGAQLTDDQRRIYKERGQPEIIFNRTSRKINGMVGVLQRLRADPKAFPRSPRNQQAAAGAELSTQVVRSILDVSRWELVQAQGILAAATHGICVYEVGLSEARESADPDITVSYVDPTTFFYDPRSVRPDFSDARYLGVYRWIDDDELEEEFHGIDPSTFSNMGDVGGTDFDIEKKRLWVDDKGRKRLVEHWYKHKGQWCFCIYIGSTKLIDGISPFQDGKGGTTHRYIAWSGMVDHDADRYGFVRVLKGPQDAINQHRSKAMHIMNSRRIWARRGTFLDVEKARKEAHKANGFVEFEGTKDDFDVEQPSTEFLQQTNYFQDAKAEIENFGPSPALIDSGVASKSGRALAIMQQNGLAELGLFLVNYRDANLRLYRMLWLTAVESWKGERWLRMADDEETVQFIGVNVMQAGPDGMPEIINSLGQIDVDIILDEGPDTTNVMGDIFDTMQSLAQNNAPIPPQVFIEMSNLPKSMKDKLMKLLEPQGPAPEQQAAMVLELADAKAKVEKTQAETQKLRADTAHGIREILSPVPDGDVGAAAGQAGGSFAEMMTAQAKAEESTASATLKRAQAAKTMQEIQMAPARFARESMDSLARAMPRQSENRVS